MVGLMATSSKRAYAIPKSAAPSHTQICSTQSPYTLSVHHWPVPPQEILKHNFVSVSVGSLGPGAHKVCLSSLSIWWVWRLILNVISSPLPSFWGFSFALGCGISPHSHSSTCCLTGVSLTLDVGYLLMATAPDLGHAATPPAPIPSLHSK